MVLTSQNKVKTMNFSITVATAKLLFTSACNVANGTKVNIDALNYVHLSIENGTAEVLGTDTLSIVRESAPIDIIDDFEICIEAKKLLAVINGYSDGEKPLHFSFNDSKAVIKHGRSKVSITTMDSNAFPIPAINMPSEFQFSCGSEHLISALNGIFYAKANNDARAFLNHVNFSICDSKMKLYTSDGHRLATNNVLMNHSVDGLQGVLPHKLVELLIQTPHTGRIDFFFDESHFFATINGTVYGSKFVAANFTDVSHIIDTELTQTIRIATTELLDSVKRIKGFMQGVRIPKLTLSFQNNELLLNSDADKGNSIDDAITATLVGDVVPADECSFSLNPSYLFDALKNIKSNDVCISFTSKSLLKITDPQNPLLSGVIMAMR